jgi:hypothetical protein
VARRVYSADAVTTSRCVAIATLTLALGCGTDDEERPSGTLRVTSEHGHHLGTFVSDPVEPVVGTNRLEATITNQSSVPVPGLTIAVQPWMPAHGHGSKVEPTVEERGEGRYDIDQIVYEMPGQWELRLEFAAAGIDDRFVLPYSVR